MTLKFHEMQRIPVCKQNLILVLRSVLEVTMNSSQTVFSTHWFYHIQFFPESVGSNPTSDTSYVGMPQLSRAGIHTDNWATRTSGLLPHREYEAILK